MKELNTESETYNNLEKVTREEPISKVVVWRGNGQDIATADMIGIQILPMFRGVILEPMLTNIEGDVDKNTRVEDVYVPYKAFTNLEMKLKMLEKKLVDLKGVEGTQVNFES